MPFSPLLFLPIFPSFLPSVHQSMRAPFFPTPLQIEQTNPPMHRSIHLFGPAINQPTEYATQTDRLHDCTHNQPTNQPTNQQANKTLMNQSINQASSQQINTSTNTSIGHAAYICLCQRDHATWLSDELHIWAQTKEGVVLCYHGFFLPFCMSPRLTDYTSLFHCGGRESFSFFNSPSTLSSLVWGGRVDGKILG